MKKYIAFIAAASLVACMPKESATKEQSASTQSAEEQLAPSGPNTITEAEIIDGWELMFDGQCLGNFRNYGDTTIGEAWVISDSALHLDATNKDDWQIKGGGDIVYQGLDGSIREFTNFHFKCEWRIAEKGNSGIMFMVHEEPETYPYPWMTGLEMQVLDNGTDSAQGHPDASIIKHSAGDLYDINSCVQETVKPAGQWNVAEILVQDKHLTLVLNGTKVVERMLFDDQWRADVAASKFVEFPGYGTFETGGIALQDHGDNVWYRNLKIKELPAATEE